MGLCKPMPQRLACWATTGIYGQPSQVSNNTARFILGYWLSFSDRSDISLFLCPLPFANGTGLDLEVEGPVSSPFLKFAFLLLCFF
jgi:hypothetical protein